VVERAPGPTHGGRVRSRIGRSKPMGIRTMLIRLLLSVASSTVALAGGAVIDCSTAGVALLGEDLNRLCVVVEPLGRDASLWVGTGLVAFAILALFSTWVPAMRRSRLRQLDPVATLQDNLSRLVEIESDPNPARSGADVLHAVRLTRRLEAIESSMATDIVPTREVTEQWMHLLREANDLHNKGELSTDDFKQINTRLLDLFSPPAEPGQTRALTGSSSTGQ